MLSDIESNENYGPSEKMNEDRKVRAALAMVWGGIEGSQRV